MVNQTSVGLVHEWLDDHMAHKRMCEAVLHRSKPLPCDCGLDAVRKAFDDVIKLLNRRGDDMVLDHERNVKQGIELEKVRAQLDETVRDLQAAENRIQVASKDHLDQLAAAQQRPIAVTARCANCRMVVEFDDIGDSLPCRLCAAQKDFAKWKARAHVLGLISDFQRWKEQDAALNVKCNHEFGDVTVMIEKPSHVIQACLKCGTAQDGEGSI